MKNIFLFIGLLCTTLVFSQKMITRSGEIKFEASVPAFEEIAATNTTASCIFDKGTGDIAVLALVKAFRFKIPLMEEHFNENYIESDKFPKATFKGKILNYDASKLASGKASFDVEGDLTLHGVTKSIKTKMNFTTSNNQLVATSNFSVKTSDFKIKIPSIVKSKIAEVVKINLKFNLENK
jgi:hypothetical protein